jgi:hypothetical protein
VPTTLRYVFVDVLESTLLDLLKQFSLTLRPEGVVTLQDHKHEHPHTP